MKKLGLIMRREFQVRVRKKSFWILTLLAPILMAALLVLPGYLASLPSETRVITVLDEALLLDFERGTDEIALRYLNPKDFDAKKAQAFAQARGDYAFVHIPISEGGDPDFLARNIVVFREGDLSLGVENYLERQVEKYLQREKLKASGVDPEILALSKTKVKLRVINTATRQETQNASLVKMGLGYLSAFLIYLFIFLYGAQVMRGVIEEKSNRIMELMMASVRPFPMMMGKILGIGGVALLQFVVWISLGGLLYFLALELFLAEALNQASQAGPSLLQEEGFPLLSLYQSLSSINFPLILGVFSFYFIFGYLLYAALFAAIGSAVDKESDSSQYMLPVSLPLVAGLIVILRALDQPDGSLAFWFSIIPFTAPVVMMARLPFGVAGWELALSMLILALSFLAFTALAAKIYRTGVLMYGKKASFRELWRWLRYPG